MISMVCASADGEAFIGGLVDYGQEFVFLVHQCCQIISLSYLNVNVGYIWLLLNTFSKP